MKILVILLLALTVHNAGAQAPFSIGWLREGLSEMVEMDKSGADFERIESAKAIHCGLFFQGFLNATNQWADQSDGKLKPLPNEWLKGFAAHESFVTYLNGFEKQHDVVIPADMPSDMFIAIWYQIKHPLTSPRVAYSIDLMLYKLHFDKSKE